MQANIILSRFIILLLTLLCNWNGSMILDDAASKSSTIRFSGELIDHSGPHGRLLENILIGGKYEAIPFYQVVSKNNQTAEKQIDPKQNKVLLDLQEIESIELKHPESPTKSEIELHGRNYVEIIVTSKHANKKSYLVESSRKLTFEEKHSTKETNLSPDQTFPGELTFIHIKKLTLKEWKSDHRNNELSVQEKTDVKNNTSQILDQIEENVKNLPKDNPSLLLQIKDSLLSLLKSLRAQLQKLADMIH